MKRVPIQAFHLNLWKTAHPARRAGCAVFQRLRWNAWIGTRFISPSSLMRRFRPYFKYLRTVRGPIAIAIICGLIYGAVGGGALPLLLQSVFKRIFDPNEPRLPLETVALIAAGIPLVFLLTSVTGYLNSYFTQLAGVRILERLRLDYFRKLQSLPLSFVQNKQTGDLISRG